MQSALGRYWNGGRTEQVGLAQMIVCGRSGGGEGE
jgi:hypothetical protein